MHQLHTGICEESLPCLEAVQSNSRMQAPYPQHVVEACAVCVLQGKQSLVTHFQNSSLLHEDKRCRPILFNSNGEVAGEQEPFPVGPNLRGRAKAPANKLGSFGSQ